MRVLSIVAEYNPFHNGHSYHINESKKQLNPDYVICVMSGNFIQRGEPALVNKWARAKMALMSGVDIVIELPTIFSMASAEYFAFAAVKILNSLGVVDYLSFGSEIGDIDKLDYIANILIDEPDSYKSYLKKLLTSGISYPAAREEALNQYISHESNKQIINVNNISDIISCSNNILGIEYLKALKKLNSSIIPHTIKRIDNDYNNQRLTGNISSATAIRNTIKNTPAYICDALKNTIPPESYSVLCEEFNLGRGPVFQENYQDIILAMIRKMSCDEIKNLNYVTEGLENRIKDMSNKFTSLTELVDAISCKRYPKTRIQRILFSLLGGLTSSEFNDIVYNGGPQYARVLGFNKKAQYLMSQIKWNSSLPIIAKTANYKNSDNYFLKRILELESIYTDLYVLGYKNSEFKIAGQEYTNRIIMH